MNEKILVVDDESSTRRVIAYTLKTIHVDVVGVGDGAQAEETAAVDRFGLAIVDINLPDMDGFEVVRRLKKIAHFRDTPIIMFTARNDREDEARALRAGATSFLYKPFSTQELRELVTFYLRSR